MKNKSLILITACMSVMLLFGCAKPRYIVPSSNIDNYLDTDSINTAKNEVAPFQKPNVDNCAQAFEREFRGVVNDAEANNGVLPSYRFIESWDNTLLKESQTYDYLTNKTESANFLTKDEGFVSFSHAPDADYSKTMELGLSGSIGGTDIFHFITKNNKPEFTALNDKINSPFWDSHPWVGTDNVCNLVLIWSSDRDNPYSVTRDVEGRPLNYGNADLFYAFKIDGAWQSPKKFDSTNSINTNKYNEISPFVACMNSAPRLLFSSNRAGDYDIYAVNINIDFSNQVISINDNAEMLPKGYESDQGKSFINTYSNEIFPIVAIPYNRSAGDKMLYLSSDRNSVPARKLNSKDTMIQSKGNFDIYKFDYSLDCSPPKIIPPKVPTAILNVELVNALNVSDDIKSPVIKIVDINTGKEIVRKGSKEQFNLEFGKTYNVYGGSEQNSNNCKEEGDSLLMYYQTKLITRLDDEIVKVTKQVKYDSTINATLITQYDTNYVTEYYPVTEQSAINTNSEIIKQEKNEQGVTIKQVTNESIKDVNLKPCARTCDTVGLNIKGIDKLPANEPLKQLMEVKKQLITKREWLDGGKVIKLTRNDIAFDTLVRYDTTMIPAIGPAGKSELTHLSTIIISSNKKDTIINDMVELYPQYYVKPPCSCEFVSLEHPYNKNVPYYQTAFWKVNTREGLTEHLEAFKEDSYLERAAYIELHPKNRKYGAGKEVRESRKKDYREYAEIVDLSLRGMKDEITKRFIPAMEALDTIAPGNKVLVKLEAYSDIRDAGSCNYIGNKIEFIHGSVSSSKIISLSDVKISSGASLNSDNDNLSKLRVYFGFQELMKRLRWDDNFMRYLKEGLVFYPTLEFDNEEERQKALDKAKIIIIAEGKKADPQVKSDETDYDSIRRLNLHIDLIRIENMNIIISPCCNPKIPTIPVNSKKK